MLIGIDAGHGGKCHRLDQPQNTKSWAQRTCLQCGICEICGSYVEGRNLHVHHKDKDRTNNSLDNLQVVCVECHNNVLHIRSRDNLGRFTKEVM